MRVSPLAAAALAAIGLAACGGSDEEDAQRVVRDIAEATSESDGEKLCRELVTREFLEQTTGAKGDKAEEQCVKQIDQLKGGGFKLVKFTKTKIDGDRAEVKAQIETQGRRSPQVFELVKEGGQFRLTTAGAR